MNHIFYLSNQIELIRYYSVALSAESVPNDAAEPDRYQGPEAGSAFREQVTTDVPDESTEATGLNK